MGKGTDITEAKFTREGWMRFWDVMARDNPWIYQQYQQKHPEYIPPEVPKWARFHNK